MKYRVISPEGKVLAENFRREGPAKRWLVNYFYQHNVFAEFWDKYKVEPYK